MLESPDKMCHGTRAPAARLPIRIVSMERRLAFISVLATLIDRVTRH